MKDILKDILIVFLLTASYWLMLNPAYKHFELPANVQFSISSLFGSFCFVIVFIGREFINKK